MRGTIITIVGLVAASSAPAADFTTMSSWMGTPEIVMTGIIALGDDAKLAAELGKVPAPQGIILMSPGGNLEASIAMGQMIRDRGLQTTVPQARVCASGCGLMWLAGNPRVMFKGAQVGFHAAYAQDGGVNREVGSGNAVEGAYFARIGLDYEAIVYLTSAPPEGMVWLQEADRERYRIPFEVEEVPPPVVPPTLEQQQVSKIAEQASRIAELENIIETQRATIIQLQQTQRISLATNVAPQPLPFAPPPAAKPTPQPKHLVVKTVAASAENIGQIFYEQLLTPRSKMPRHNLWFFGKGSKPLAQR